MIKYTAKSKFSQNSNKRLWRAKRLEYPYISIGGGIIETKNKIETHLLHQ